MCLTFQDLFYKNKYIRYLVFETVLYQTYTIFAHEKTQ